MNLLKPRELLEDRGRIENDCDWLDEDDQFHAILGKCIQGRATQNELSNDFGK